MTTWGINQMLSQDGSTRTERIRLARWLGCKMSRLNFNWKTMETADGTFVWNANHDQAVSELAEAGIEPIGVILGSPQWASGSASEFVVPGTNVDATYLTWEGHYCDFCTEVVKRYKGVIKRWEIWNEENDEFFWPPAANQLKYNHLYPAARTAILAVDSTAKVAMGGCPPTTGGNGVWLKDWLPAMYAAGVFPDYVAIHPYTDGPGTRAPDVHVDWSANFDDIAVVRSKQVAQGGSALVPIWITEFGWDTTHISQALQAQYIAQAMEMIRDTYTYVDLALLFCDIDALDGSGWGLFTSADLSAAKTAAYPFKVLAR